MVDPAQLLFGAAVGTIIAWPTRRVIGVDGKPTPATLLEEIKVKKPRFYHTITLDMATARTDKEFPEVADYIIIDNHDASVPCYIRLNELGHEKLDLRRFEILQGATWRFYITNEVGTGSIDLLICYGMSFLPREKSGRKEKLIPFHTLRSDKDDHFTGAIAQNAVEEESLTGLISNKVTITGVVILSDQQLNYRVILYSTDAFANTDLDVDALFNEVEFDLPGYGWRIAGTGKYCMVITGLEIDYIDEDATKELHVALQNLSATGKTAGGDGEVVLRFTYEERD